MHLGHCWRRTKDGPRRIDEVFDPVKLSEHAAGTNVYGLCPIAPGTDTTRVALLDLDSHKGEIEWSDMRNLADTIAMCLEEDGYRPILFRSTGGMGIHLYLLWDTPQDAYSVRTMLRTTLRTCGLEDGTGGVVKGQVEVYPKQDEVPADGYGSMFVLPLSPATKSERLK